MNIEEWIIQKENPAEIRQDFLFGGDNRTRTCDLMRVKHRRAFRPDQRRSNQPKLIENQWFFITWKIWQYAKHQSLTSCLHAKGIIAHPVSKSKTLEQKIIIFFRWWTSMNISLSSVHQRKKKLFEKRYKYFKTLPSIGHPFWYNKAIKSEGNKDKNLTKTKKYFCMANGPRKGNHYV